MKSISEIIALLQLIPHVHAADTAAGALTLRTRFVAPTLHLDAINEAFEGLDTDVRLSKLQEWLDETQFGEPGLLMNAMARLPVTINALTPEEAGAKLKWLNQSNSVSWVSSFIGQAQDRPEVEDGALQKYVHFYGYKGGQGRSTVLALLAKALADDGYRVLLVDADIEAPSLDHLFGVSADSFAQTLMGLCGWADEVHPIAGVYSGRLGGRIDLLPCRPRTEGADLDFALLVTSAPLDGRIYERAAEKLQQALLSRDERYDVAIVDHRTGVASSVLPLMSRLPGSAAVFARTDFNTANVPSELLKVVRSIFSNTSSVPGVFVSFSLDPNKAASSQSPVEARLRETLLGELAGAMERRGSGEDQPAEVSVADLSLNWVNWYLDRSLLEPVLPDVVKLQSDNISSLNLLREALALPIGRRDPILIGRSFTPVAQSVTSLSGAKDAAQFIHIPEIEKLFIQGNPYSYILGRKGTGKTRLLRELATRGLGVPILVAADQENTLGLQSNSIEATTWLERCEFDAASFWWSLVRVAIERSPNESLGVALSDYARRMQDPKKLADRLEIKNLVLQMPEPMVLLVDGLETLVSADKIKAFVAALFDLMGTLQNDTSLASKLIVRVFVREDLAADTVQNVEQQMEGRAIRLKWGASSILNFAISRIPSLPWIRKTFVQTCQKIEDQWAAVARSSLGEQESTELLLSIFPSRLRRNNLSTATFLRLYFSDAGGDDTNKATFYPRLYFSFLQRLDELGSDSPQPLDGDGHIDSALLNRAYDGASGEFINETKQELTYLLSLEYENKDEKADDATRVSRFVAAFDGMSTPFQPEVIIADLRSKTNFTDKSVRESLQRMKSIRMFEDRPGYGGWWRVGQLYKMGLRMKYVRG